jgi:hypothetical protein
MRIPVGNFGNVVAQPATGGTRVPQGAFGDSSTMITLGQQTQRVAGQLIDDQRKVRDEQAKHDLQMDLSKQRERFQIEQQRARELESAQRMQAYASYGADVDDLTFTLIDRLDKGEIKRDDLPGLFAKAAEGIKQKRLEGLDQESQATVSAHMITAERKAQGLMRVAIDKNQTEERKSLILTAAEDIQRMGVKDPARAVQTFNAMMDVHGAGVFGADKVAAQKQAFSERVYATHFTERLTQSRNSYQGLNALEKDIAANPVLDPDKKNILIGRISGMKDHMEARAERAAASRDRALQAQIGAMDSMILKGFEPSAQQLMAVQQSARGTPYEAVVRAQISFANQTAGFRAMNTREQEAFVNDFEKQVRTNPSPDGIKTLESYRTMQRNQAEAVKEDPISFAAQKRLAEIQPLDLTQPATLGDQLKARTHVARGMQQQYGAPLKVLTKQEAQSLTDMLKKGGVDQKRQLLGALYNGIGDVTAYRATMSQIAQDDPVLAAAGIAEAQQRSTNQGGRVSDLILRGQQILRQDTKEDGKPGGGKLFALPKQEETQRSFNSYARDAFAGKENARNVMYQSAQSIYAALSVEVGDYSGELKSNRWESAMRLATGGIEKRNGKAIVMPYGYDGSRFKNELKSKSTALVASGRMEGGITPGDLMNMPMENIGDGRYVFRIGDGVLVDKAKLPVVVDFNQ